MRPFAALERFLERLFERPGARLFASRLEPVTILRRLERTIDQERRPGPDGPVAPTRFRVVLNAADLATLQSADALEDDLAEAALEHARRRGYRIPERPTVAVVSDPAAAPASISIRVAFADASVLRHEPAVRAERTMVHPVAVPATPVALLHVVEPGGQERMVPVNGSPLRIGRAADNEVAVGDPLISRHHAAITTRSGRLVLTDLNSTNGTRVNGRSVVEAVLGAGDRIEMGGTRIEVTVPGGPWTG